MPTTILGPRARTGQTLAVLACLTVLVCSGTSTAAAGEPDPADIALAAAPAVPLAASVIAPDGALESRTGTTEVTIPDDADGAVTFESATGESVQFAVPGGSAGTTDNGAMVYQDTAPNTDIVVQPTTTGARALIKIDGADAPTTFSFPVTVPDGGALALTDTGGAVVLNDQGEPVVDIPIPWAKDATGKAVPTRFEIIDGQLIQHVEHRSADTAYPVVADPWWHWVKGKLKLVWRGIITTKIMVWWYESHGYTCDWWAAWWNAPVACYQTAS